MINIKNSNNLINNILNAIEGNLDLNQIRLILLVLEKGRVTGPDISKSLSLSKATVSFNIANLTRNQSFFIKDSIGILEIQKNENGESKFVALSKEGTELINNILEDSKEKAA